jgi:hypothetical protein
MVRSISSRLGGAAVALVLGAAGLAAAGAVTPASANGSSCTTTTSIDVYQSTVVHGDYDRVSGDVTAHCTGGTAPVPTYVSYDAGKAVIERSLDNGASWQVVAGNQYSDTASLYGDDVVPLSGLYRVRYTGGTSSYGDRFAPSVSRSVRIDVIRALSVKDRSTRSYSFTLSPVTGLVGHKLVFQVKKGARWRRYKAVRLRATGVFKVSFANSRRGISYRLNVPAAAGLSAYTYGPFKAYRR